MMVNTHWLNATDAPVDGSEPNRAFFELFRELSPDSPAPMT